MVQQSSANPDNRRSCQQSPSQQATQLLWSVNSIRNGQFRSRQQHPVQKGTSNYCQTLH